MWPSSPRSKRPITRYLWRADNLPNSCLFFRLQHCRLANPHLARSLHSTCVRWRPLSRAFTLTFSPSLPSISSPCRLPGCALADSLLLVPLSSHFTKPTRLNGHRLARSDSNDRCSIASISYVSSQLARGHKLRSRSSNQIP